MMNKALGLLSTALLLGACNSPLDTAAELSALRSQLEEIEQLSPRELDEYVSFFTTDTVLLPPDLPAIHGKDSALEFYESGFAGVESWILDYSEAVIDLSGDLAVRTYSGTAKLVFEDSPEPVTLKSKYLDVLKRQPDGSWKISIHTWGADD